MLPVGHINLKAMKTTLLLLAAWLCGAAAFCQTSLSGKVVDAESGEPILFASVALYTNGALTAGTETDFDGNYSFSNVNPGTYEVEVSYVGYAKRRVDGVEVTAGKANSLDIEISSAGVVLQEVVVTDYKVPLVEQDNLTSGGMIITSDQIRNLPTRNIKSLAATTAGLSGRKKNKGREGKEISIRSSRSGATDYYIDGVRVRGEGGAATVSAARSGPTVLAGQLTAGEWSDLDNWATWTELLEEDFLPFAQIWELAPKNRYSVEVKNKKGAPVANCRARLKNSTGKILWSTLTDNNGRAELWSAEAAPPQAIELEYEGLKARIDQPRPYLEAINQSRLTAECQENQSADVFLVVDATSSMSDEIHYLKAELEDAMLRVERNLPGTELRTGALFYRDHQDAYLTRSSALSPILDSTLAFIHRQSAGGGGDGPEAVEVALKEALEKQDWNPQASARLIFLILDAPPHQTPEIRQSLQQSIQKAAEIGVRIIPVAGSGIDKSTEYLMKALAISTNGSYAFLTNHSGIGGGHIEPTAGPYDVLLLNDLMVKLILENVIMPPCSEEKSPEVPSADQLNPALLAQVKCFPNPATGPFYLRLEQDFDRVVIRNLEGKLIQEKEKLKKGDHEFNADNWAPGLYLLELHKGDEVAVEKLVVERTP